MTPEFASQDDLQTLRTWYQASRRPARSGFTSRRWATCRRRVAVGRRRALVPSPEALAEHRAPEDALMRVLDRWPPRLPAPPR
jgi:hypothetical protein